MRIDKNTTLSKAVTRISDTEVPARTCNYNSLQKSGVQLKGFRLSIFCFLKALRLHRKKSTRKHIPDSNFVHAL